MMTLTFFALAASLLGLFFAIRMQVKTIVGYIGMFLLVLSAIGYFVAGVFPTDPITTPMEEMTFSGQMHGLGAMLDWLPVAALLIGLSLSRSTGWSIKKKSLLTMTVVMIVLMFAFIGAAASAPNGQFGPGVYAGLLGRLIILSYFCWITIITRHTINIAKVPKYE